VKRETPSLLHNGQKTNIIYKKEKEKKKKKSWKREVTAVAIGICCENSGKGFHWKKNEGVVGVGLKPKGEDFHGGREFTSFLMPKRLERG